MDKKLSKILKSMKLPKYDDLVYVIEKLIEEKEYMSFEDIVACNCIRYRAKIKEFLRNK